MKAKRALSLVAMALAAGSALAQESATLMVATNPEHGQYLADGEGRALYLFEADTQGKGGAAAMSACKDDCAVAWPPLVTAGAPQPGEGVSAEMVGTVQRPDGTMQVTYNGWPLYYFAKDQSPGDTMGQDIEGFGAEWYLLTPAGEKVHD